MSKNKFRLISQPTTRSYTLIDMLHDVEQYDEPWRKPTPQEQEALLKQTSEDARELARRIVRGKS